MHRFKSKRKRSFEKLFNNLASTSTSSEDDKDEYGIGEIKDIDLWLF